MNRMKNRICAFLLLILPLSMLLSGCGEEITPVEIVLMHGWGGTLKNHKTMQQIYDRFQEENPDILLTRLPSSDSTIAVKNANDMLAVNQMADIVSTNGLSYFVENAVKQEKALDLSPYLEADEEFDREVHPLVKDTWTREGGSIYTLPDALEVMGFWYNEAYLKEAGVTDEQGNVKLPEDWPGFMDMCKKLAAWCKDRKGVDPFALEKVQISENLFFARLAGDGPEGLSMTKELPESFDKPAMKHTVRDLGQLIQWSKYVDSIDNARQLFMEGKTALYFNGIWESEILKDSLRSDELKSACYPSNDGRTLSYVSPSSGYVVYDSKDEKKIEACIRFLKYMLSEEVQKKIALETGQAPENPNLEEETILKAYPMFGQALKNLNGSEIQILTLSSVWGSRMAECVNRTLESGAKDEEHYELFLKQLEEARP